MLDRAGHTGRPQPVRAGGLLLGPPTAAGRRLVPAGFSCRRGRSPLSRRPGGLAVPNCGTSSETISLGPEAATYPNIPVSCKRLGTNRRSPGGREESGGRSSRGRAIGTLAPNAGSADAKLGGSLRLRKPGGCRLLGRCVCGCRRKSLSLSPTGSTWTYTLPGSRPICGRLGIAAGRRVVDFVGRLEPQKGVRWLIERPPCGWHAARIATSCWSATARCARSLEAAAQATAIGRPGPFCGLAGRRARNPGRQRLSCCPRPGRACPTWCWKPWPAACRSWPRTSRGSGNCSAQTPPGRRCPYGNTQLLL